MEVATVDECDLDRRTPQLRNRLEAAESSADDDDAVLAGIRGARSAHDSLSIFVRLLLAAAPHNVCLGVGRLYTGESVGEPGVGRVDQRIVLKR
jgi:hypothetical protein